MPAKKGAGSVAAQIDYLKQRKIFVSPKCTNLIAELQAWRWRLDSNGELTDTPVDVFDDAIAALRYAISGKLCDEGISFLK